MSITSPGSCVFWEFISKTSKLVYKKVFYDMSINLRSLDLKLLKSSSAKNLSPRWLADKDRDLSQKSD